MNVYSLSGPATQNYPFYNQDVAFHVSSNVNQVQFLFNIDRSKFKHVQRMEDRCDDIWSCIRLSFKPSSSR